MVDVRSVGHKQPRSGTLRRKEETVRFAIDPGPYKMHMGNGEGPPRTNVTLPVMG